ncbi:MAG: PEPxxWA-CTERM sorting domain-containing protein [Pseudomonadota bacterium]
MAAAALAAISIAAPASAEIIVLDFEGVGNLNPVGNYYNGGGGTDYGVEFSADTLAVVDADNGGSGNFANEPSPNTIMFFLNANNAILNFAAGFTTGFSFFYSSSTAATVNVYDGLDGTGNLLGSLNLDAQGFQGCTGDPSGQFCNWTAVGVAFAGTAKSINFGGTANQTGFDDITFGSDRPGGGTIVPEPSTWAMMLLGFAGLGTALRTRRRLAIA